jgi:Carboxypeptidase regulatory-like domain
MSRLTVRLTAAVGAVLLITGVAACGGVQTLSYPTPPATSPTTLVSGPTLPSNLATVAEGAVPGSTNSTAPAIGPGGATLDGTVLGPNGPVGGATVEAERLVGDQVASTEAITAADGSWRINSILGGRYRVRAWHAPNLAVLTPQIFFLAATQTETLSIQLTPFTGAEVAAAIAPSAPVVGEMANLVVQVTNPTVGSDGIVRDLPEVGVSVTLTNGPLWDVYNGNPQPTDADGQALFQVSCQYAGPLSMSATVGNGAPVPLELPDCSPAPTTTTTPTTVFRPTTTTTPCPTTTLGGTDQAGPATTAGSSPTSPTTIC